jgi:DNA-binding LacI/PurR family transcriptional regulator
MAPTVPAGRVTLEMVAAAAGVSRGTASRVLTGSPKVSELAATAVREAARSLGYRPNLSARGLVTGRTGLVGFAVDEDDDRLFTDPYFARLVRGMHHELAGSDHALVVSLVSGVDERDRLLELAATRLDGLLLAHGHGDPALAEDLAALGAPVVFAGRMPATGPAERTTWVDSDSLGGTRAAVRHLLDRGRSRVACITGPLTMAAGLDRLEGWRRTLAEAGLPHGDDLTAPGGFRTEQGRRAMTELLARHPDLDAVCCANDLSAFGAMEVLAAAGRRVPEDVAVVGFDDLSSAATSLPPLTTVRQEIELVGRRMARLLLDMLGGRTEPVQEVLPTTLVVRGSS